MAQPPNNNQNQPPLFTAPGGRFNPGQMASVMGMYIRALIMVVFWGIAGVAAIAVGYVAVRAIWFAVNTASTALGI